MILRGNKRGQLTIFVIVAIVVVIGAILFFVFRQNLVTAPIPANIQPAYNSFLACLKDDTSVGIDVMESQAGYIFPPQFEPGSQYMPFSNQLNFLGNPIPYWYYVSGNNIPKEQIPTKNDMQNQLANFLNSKIRDCNFDQFYSNNFQINMGNPITSVTINDNSVDISLSMNLNMTRGNDTAFITTHKISVNSQLGTLYNSARKVYDYEQNSMFLENYTIDDLRLYAPVDGVDITCNPDVWNINDVFTNLKNGIVANTLAINTLANQNYFVRQLPVSQQVNFLTDSNWSSAFDVTPSNGNLLTATPVGNQPGLGILGFCYVPYHFVYNVKYPVLIQVSGNGETFQFPFAIVIQGNKPRQPLNATSNAYQLPQLCSQENTSITVKLFDTNLNPVNNAQISYKCFGTLCNIGNTSSGVLNANFPQCINGFVVTNANGFKTNEYQYSVINAGEADIILDRSYPANLSLLMDGAPYTGQATITFVFNNTSSQTLSYPQQNQINLSEGQYAIQVYMYRNSTLQIGAISTQQCINVPQSNIGGAFGFTQQKCYTINFPSQIVSNALAGGGNQNYYILASQLNNSKTISINANSLPNPTTIQQLQDNYNLVAQKNLSITLQ